MAEVFNEGRAGDTTVELLARFDASVAAHEPDLVTILVGSNDMFYPGHMMAPEAFRHNLEALLEHVCNLGAGMILFTIPAMVETLLVENYPDTLKSPLSPAERFQRVNAVIRECAEDYLVPVVDLAQRLRPADESAASMVMNEANSGRRDGMHLVPQALGIMARAVFDLQKRCFPDAKRIVCLGDSITYGVYVKGKGSARPDAETYPGQLAKLLENAG